MRLGNAAIQIVPFEAVHAGMLYKWHLTGKYPWFFGNSELKSLEKWAQLKYAYMVVDATDFRNVLGCFILNEVDETNRLVSVHLLIDEGAQNQKIGFEASKLFLFYVFNQLNFYKIIAKVVETNVAVGKLLNKMGFKQEGHLKKHLLVDGERYDVLQYGLLKTHFNREFGDSMKEAMKE